MTWLRLLFDATGRVGPRGFVMGVVGIYTAWFAVPMAIALAMLFDPPMDDGGVVMILLAIPVVMLLQFAVLPYTNVCLHLKRLRDAGRGPISLIAIVAFSALAVLLCGTIGAMHSFGPSRLSGAPMPTASVLTMTIASGMTIAAWPLYSVWVAMGRSERTPAQDFEDLVERLA